MNNLKGLLDRIYGVLLTISVKGEDSIAMAECLINLKNILENYQEPAVEKIKEEE